MMDKTKVTQVVFSAIDDLNQQLPGGDALKKAPETALFGRGSPLDSLGLVNLIVGVEQGVAEELGAEVSLADERAMSQTSSPFRTVGSLVDYVAQCVEAAQNA